MYDSELKDLLEAVRQSAEAAHTAELEREEAKLQTLIERQARVIELQEAAVEAVNSAYTSLSALLQSDIEAQREVIDLMRGQNV